MTDDPGSGNGASHKQRVCREVVVKRRFFWLLQAVSNSIQWPPLFGIVREAVTRYLSDYQSYLFELDSLCLSTTPDNLTPVCFARLKDTEQGDKWNIRRLPDASERAWITVPPGYEVGIIAQSGDFYLVQLGPDDLRFVGWVARSAVRAQDIGQCGSIPFDLPDISFPIELETGGLSGYEDGVPIPRYVLASYGIQRALQYGNTHSGWWGNAGELDMLDILAWAIDRELISLASGIEDPEERSRYIDWAIQANYARLQNAMLRCFQAPWDCEGWYQYFSGLTVTFLTEPVQAGQGTWENFVTWPDYPNRYADIVDRLNKAGSEGDLSLSTQYGWNWWRLNEIAECRRHCYITDTPNNSLYQHRYTIYIGEGEDDYYYLFAGYPEQFAKRTDCETTDCS
jgi:hypothetical protein